MEIFSGGRCFNSVGSFVLVVIGSEFGVIQLSGVDRQVFCNFQLENEINKIDEIQF